MMNNKCLYVRLTAGLIVKFVLIGYTVCISGCTCVQNKPAAKIEIEKSVSFPLPEIPEKLISPEERAEYLGIHYWDKFDFRDTMLITRPEITEQAFVDFIQILPYTKNPKESISRMFDRSTVDSTMFAHFRELAEKYLYDPNSPMRNEELYIPVLEYLVASDKLDRYEKMRSQYQLEMAYKNRPGMTAADFTYTLSNGRNAKMSDIESDYTILFFNNPDCHDCQRVKEYMASSSVITSPKVTVLAVYIDGDIPLWRKARYPKFMLNAYDASQTITDEQLYDLKAIPTLYLLDQDKQVILKDTSIEAIEAWLCKYIITRTK